MKSCLPNPQICRWLQRRRHAVVQRANISSRSAESDHELASSLANNGHATQVEGCTRNKLPLPPLMSPDVLSARYRYKTAKARPKHDELSEFQKRLHANSFAHALASPMRRCTFTNVRLPSDFLISFRPIKNPTTKKTWLLPVDLLPKSAKPRRIGPSNHFLNRDNLMRFLIHSKRKPTDAYLDINVRRHLSSENDRIVWREDMPDYVLRLLREQVTRRLRWLLTHHDTSRIAFISTPYPVLDPLADEVSCVLQLKSEHSQELRELSRRVEESAEEIAYHIVPQFFRLYQYSRGKATSSGKEPPLYPLVPAPPEAVLSRRLEFSTLRVRRDKGRVAHFKLWEMLGDHVVKTLFENTEAEEDGTRWAIIKPHAKNVGLEKALNQLQGYLATRKV